MPFVSWNPLILTRNDGLFPEHEHLNPGKPFPFEPVSAQPRSLNQPPVGLFDQAAYLRSNHPPELHKILRRNIHISGPIGQSKDGIGANVAVVMRSAQKAPHRPYRVGQCKTVVSRK